MFRETARCGLAAIIHNTMNAAGLAGLLGLVVVLSACDRREQAAEMKLARALDALQQGHVTEAARHLSTIKAGGGWLRSPTWNAPLALRLRSQISLKLGALEETRRLLGEYEKRYSMLGPGAYVRKQLEFLQTYRDAGGEPALLYLRGEEAEEESPTIALREWQKLLRDYPDCALAPATRLKLGRLQARLGNAAWALAALSDAVSLPSDVLDVEGNPVAPQARLVMAQVRRDLWEDRRAAREDFTRVIEDFPDTTLSTLSAEVVYSIADQARYEIAMMDRAARQGGLNILGTLADISRSPTGYVAANFVGDIRAEARLELSEAALGRRDWASARTILVGIANDMPNVTAGRPGGPHCWYGYKAADKLVSRLGPHSPDQALKGLDEIAAQARLREIWAYANLQKVRLLARMGMHKEARDIQAEMENRFPNLDCDARGDGMLFMPAREALRLLGG
jgi:tetratricopeptide (TPR) repeat protein